MSTPRPWVVLPLLFGLCSGAQASAWTDLWRTPDQQGQHLIEQHQPEQAAQVFTDAQHRGYAELEAGRYAQAAKTLESSNDPDSQYNRGNALAHAGQLQQALEAYDRSLKAAPGNPDVIKNRKLVAEALKQQTRSEGKQHQGTGGGEKDASQQSQQDQNSAQGQHGGGSGDRKSGSQPSQQNKGENPSAKPQTDESQNAPQPGASRAAASGKKPSAGDDKTTSSDRTGRTKADATAQIAAKGGASVQAPAQNAARPHDSSAGDSARQPAASEQLARNSSATAGGKGTPEAPNGDAAAAGVPSAGSDRTAVQRDVENPLQVAEGVKDPRVSPPSAPLTEESLALDQWLRGIPDDSGELLQRKFMIEHLVKQQGRAP